MEGEGRTTITVSRKVKNRFLKFIGAPKKYTSADEALVALLDRFDGKGEQSILEETKHGARSGRVV